MLQVDPTGAGDTFAGGFVGWLAQSGSTDFENLKRAVVCGSALASFCVGQFSIDGIRALARDGIDARIHRLRALTDFSFPGSPSLP